MPIGSITRGTTGTNRLRRVDRWISRSPSFTLASHPLVVDLGFGASATTTVELHQRLARHRPHVEVVGIEIDPQRVLAAAPAARDGVEFRVGGFEIPLADGRHASVIRALNVLRQYDESVVREHWRRMVARLEPGGVLVEGTCNELGRVASWVDVTADGPRSLTVSLRLADLDTPSIVAERLPKALIHRNVPGEPVHRFLRDLDRCWQTHAALGTYGPAQRFIATAASLVEVGWPVVGGRSRWRLGELSLSWHAIAPLGFSWE